MNNVAMILTANPGADLLSLLPMLLIIGGMAMAIGKVYITTTACALVLGILTNFLLNKFKKNDSEDEE